MQHEDHLNQLQQYRSVYSSNCLFPTLFLYYAFIQRSIISTFAALNRPYVGHSVSTVFCSSFNRSSDSLVFTIAFISTFSKYVRTFESPIIPRGSSSPVISKSMP